MAIIDDKADDWYISYLVMGQFATSELKILDKSVVVISWKVE